MTHSINTQMQPTLSNIQQNPQKFDTTSLIHYSFPLRTATMFPTTSKNFFAAAHPSAEDGSDE
jgi:hypothetical protein